MQFLCHLVCNKEAFWSWGTRNLHLQRNSQTWEEPIRRRCTRRLSWLTAREGTWSSSVEYTDFFPNKSSMNGMTYLPGLFIPDTTEYAARFPKQRPTLFRVNLHYLMRWTVLNGRIKSVTKNFGVGSCRKEIGFSDLLRKTCCNKCDENPSYYTLNKVHVEQLFCFYWYKYQSMFSTVLTNFQNMRISFLCYVLSFLAGFHTSLCSYKITLVALA